MNRLIALEHLPAHVILTDDPMRVRMLAAHYLDHAQTLFEQRGMIGMEGTYREEAVAVISCGFGQTAAELYTAECADLGARTLIYLGECVSRTGEAPLMAVILAEGGAPDLLRRALAAAPAMPTAPTRPRVCPVRTDDRYWLEPPDDGGDLIDFATAGVYRAAAARAVAALAMLTVSEHAVTGERIDDSVRQSRFHSAAVLAFETLVTK